MIKQHEADMDDFDTLKRYIEQTLKIQCSSYKEDYIKRRLLSRMRSTNSADYGAYLRYLKITAPELEPIFSGRENVSASGVRAVQRERNPIRLP
jgi:hypothetical protein